MKSVLITGANRGIGLEFVKKYKKLGYDVYATARKPLDGDLAKEIDKDHFIQLDVSSTASIAGLKDAKLPGKLDLIINNAGVLEREGIDDAKLAEHMLSQFQVNSMAPILVTAVLKDKVKNGRVVNVTSRMGSIEDNTSGGYYGYRMSKAALNAGTKSLALDLANQGTIVALVHPGYIRTNMTRGNGDMDPDECVERLSKVIEGLKKEDSGKFFHRDGEILPW